MYHCSHLSLKKLQNKQICNINRQQMMYSTYISIISSHLSDGLAFLLKLLHSQYRHHAGIRGKK